jgi:hypothetical protein
MLIRTALQIWQQHQITAAPQIARETCKRNTRLGSRNSCWPTAPVYRETSTRVTGRVPGALPGNHFRNRDAGTKDEPMLSIENTEAVGERNESRIFDWIRLFPPNWQREQVAPLTR